MYNLWCLVSETVVKNYDTGKEKYLPQVNSDEIVLGYGDYKGEPLRVYYSEDDYKLLSHIVSYEIVYSYKGYLIGGSWYGGGIVDYVSLLDKLLMMSHSYNGQRLQYLLPDGRWLVLTFDNTIDAFLAKVALLRNKKSIMHGYFLLSINNHL